MRTLRILKDIHDDVVDFIQTPATTVVGALIVWAAVLLAVGVGIGYLAWGGK